MAEHLDLLRDYICDLVHEAVDKRLAELREPERDQWMTTKQVAQMTGLAMGTFYVGRSRNAARNPKYPTADLPPHYKVGTSVLYRKGDVLDWMARRRAS